MTMKKQQTAHVVPNYHKEAMAVLHEIAKDKAVEPVIRVNAAVSLLHALAGR